MYRVALLQGARLSVPDFSIAGPADGRLVVRLLGLFDEPTAIKLEEEVLRALEPSAPASLLVTVDLCGLVDCHIFARTVLVRVQKAIAVKARRTAYLADRPRFRGLGQWIAHLAADGNARAVVSQQQLDEWLSGSVERIDEAEARFARATQGVAKMTGGAR